MILIQCEIKWIGGKVIVRRLDRKIDLIFTKKAKGIDFDTFIHCTEVGVAPDFSPRLGCDQYRTAMLTPSGIDRSLWVSWPDLPRFFYPDGLPAELILRGDYDEQKPEESKPWPGPLFTNPPPRAGKKLPSSTEQPRSRTPPTQDEMGDDDDGDTVERYTGVMIYDSKTSGGLQINKDKRLTQYMLSGRSAIDHKGVTKLKDAVVNVVGSSNAKGHAEDPTFTNKITRKRK